MMIVEYNGKTTEQYDLVVTHLTRRMRAKERVERHEIEGRNGVVTDRLGTYESYSREMEITNIKEDKIMLVYDWLDGHGILKTSVDKGGFFKAEVVSAIEREHLACQFNSMVVEFEVDPFFYLNSGTEELSITGQVMLVNIGTIYSEPTIKVYGSGSGTIQINDQVVTIPSISNYAIIDSTLKMTTKDGLPVKMIGDYPILPEGDSLISFSGGITKLEITPNWREK